MPTLAELSDNELLLKQDKITTYLELVNKEIKRRGLRKNLVDHLTSWLDTTDVKVTAPRPTSPFSTTSSRSTTSNVETSIRKTTKPTTRLEVVSSSDEDDDPALKKGFTHRKKTAPKPPKPPKTKSAPKSASKTSSSSGSKRPVEKATVQEIKTVLTRNGVTFKSRDTKADLLKLAGNKNLIRTIEFYHIKNSS